eukprot:1158846-Pelagomonas_calceolata.AAC.1
MWCSKQESKEPHLPVLIQHINERDKAICLGYIGCVELWHPRQGQRVIMLQGKACVKKGTGPACDNAARQSMCQKGVVLDVLNFGTPDRASMPISYKASVCLKSTSSTKHDMAGFGVQNRGISECDNAAKQAFVQQL